jgi:hypothetical protein
MVCPSEAGIFAELSLDFVCSIGGLFRIPPISSSRSSFVLLSLYLSVQAEVAMQPAAAGGWARGVANSPRTPPSPENGFASNSSRMSSLTAGGRDL